MAFFKKLKERLFKSSSKLEEGLDAIVKDGGEPSDEQDLPDQATPQKMAPKPAKSEVVLETMKKTSKAVVIEPVAIQVESGASKVDPPKTDFQPLTTVDEKNQASLETVDFKKIDPAPVLEAAVEKSAPSKGFIGRLMGRKAETTAVRRVLDDPMLEQLEDLLISSDMGVDAAMRVTANIAEGRLGKKLSSGEIKSLLSQEITRIMEPVAKPLPLYSQTPQVVLVVGVNGSGKTTTIGKLASQFKVAGKSVIIAAGDTFRAAAVEQLQIWGDRAGVPVLTAAKGSDPASLAFDAIEKARADKADLLLIDTAGRLQNRTDLMEELSKIVRVIKKQDPDAPHNTLLVLDATTGQNALNQVDTFRRLADVSGLVMTKLDGTAKGGVLVALADKFGLPIHAIGIGEQIDDLSPFDPEEYAKALTGQGVP
ncbi:signal recognition particle-docking protein FtsY [Paracoccaceae bacterium]|nr:signal recognition particle-docking protein FtsY [Paracoccaceae bacterium]